MRNKQSGFSIVEGVIAVFVIAILGFIGWSVYSNYNHPNKKTANATTNNTNTSQPSNETTTAATVTPQGTYLDIKELGIKILLNDQVSDAMYSIVPTTDGSKGAGISAKSLINKSPDCAPNHYTLGLIEATTTAPTNVSGQAATPDNKSLFKFGNTYYWYRPPQNQTCLTDNQTDIDMVTSKLNAFEQAFTTVQPDN